MFYYSLLKIRLFCFNKIQKNKNEIQKCSKSKSKVDFIYFSHIFSP